MEHETYIWDLDGTLFDSYGVIVASVAEIVRTDGHPCHEEDILRILKRESLSVFLKDYTSRFGGSADSLFDRYREISHRNNNRITLIPGALETLRSLSEAGAEHYVYTHRGESTHGILKRLGIAEFFRDTVTSEAGFAPKPSGEGVRYLTGRYGLDPEHTWYVGDRQLDVLCGKDAGVKAVLFLPEDSCVTPTGREDRIVRRLTELTENERI